MSSETPTVVHSSSPSAEVTSTLVTARVPPGAAVTVTVTPTQGGAGRASRLLAANPAGQVHAELPVSSGGQGYQVQAAWSDRGQRWSLTTPATDPTSP